ncbi:MAG: xylulokinase [Actinomycetota bacterium]
MARGGGDGEYLIGLDLGTTGAKAGIVSPTGKVIATAARSYDTVTSRPGWAEQDPDDWWRASTASIGAALEASGLPAPSIAGIGLSGQMHGSVFLDASGSVIRPCILWCDQRTAPQCRWIEDHVGAEKLSRLVQNPALAGFTAPKVLWLRENEPENYARVRTLLLPKDYVNWRLTGRQATESSDASGTLLFDVRERSWSNEMLELLDVPPGWLPDVLESSEALGGMTREAGEATGLLEGTPVACGGADNACGALGMGVVRPGQVAVSIGTSGTVLSPTSKPLTDPAMRLHTFCHVVPGTWYVMGVMLSAGLSLRWFRDQLGEPERTLAGRQGRDAYELLEETAEGAPAGCEGLVFLPYLTGERTPHADPQARGVLFGLDLTKTRSHVIRSVMEGVVFGLKDSLELMKELGVPIETLVSGGGGSRSGLWRQMLADSFELPLFSPRESDSAMLGAALLAGVASGVFSSVDEAALIAREGEHAAPDPTAFEAYRQAYAKYRSLYPALRPLFDR